MKPTRIPFKQMKTTIATLQGAILLIISTLKADNLNPTDMHLVASVMKAKEKSAQLLKRNPSRKQMLVMCGVWYLYAEKANSLLQPDQTDLSRGLQEALAAASWVKQTMTLPKMPEVMK